jgi:hypothetical protein
MLRVNLKKELELYLVSLLKAYFGRVSKKVIFLLSTKSEFRLNFILISSKFRCFDFPKFRFLFRCRNRNFDSGFNFDCLLSTKFHSDFVEISTSKSEFRFRHRNSYFDFGIGIFDFDIGVPISSSKHKISEQNIRLENQNPASPDIRYIPNKKFPLRNSLI